MTSKRPMTFDHLKSTKKPLSRTVKLATDADLADEYEAAKDTVDRIKARAGRNGDGVSAELGTAEAALQTAKKALEAVTVTFRFQALGRKKYEALLDAHPPTEAQRKEVEAAGNDGNMLLWNSDTFPVAIVKACMVEPEFTDAEIEELWDGDLFNSAELMTLWMAAYEVNVQRRIVDLGNA